MTHLVTHQHSPQKPPLKVGIEPVTTARYAVQKHGSVHEAQRLAVHREAISLDVVDHAEL